MKYYKQTLPSEILSTLLTVFSFKPKADKMKLRVISEGYERIKPPYLIVINHPSAEDHMIASAVMAPQRLNFVVNAEDFSQKSFLMKMMGAIPRRMFTVDVEAVMRMRTVFKSGGVVALFPEGKTSPDGRRGYISRNVIKLMKVMRLPVVAMNISGTYTDKPLAARNSRGGRAEVRLTNLFSADDVDYMDDETMYRQLLKALDYDECEFQRARKIEIKGNAAPYVNVLYQCPECGKEYTVIANKNELKCKNCSASWSLGRYGVLMGERKKTVDSIPDWYAYERAFTAEQIEKSVYELKGTCTLKIMRAIDKGYKDAGKGHFEHDSENFVYTGSMEGRSVSLSFANADRPTLNMKYGDSVEFSSPGISYKFILDNPAAAAKINLVIEETFRKTFEK